MPTKKAAASVDRRGQIELELEGVAYGLRPSFNAIEAIERQTRPLGELVELLNMDRLPIGEMGVITAELMKAYGAAHPDDEKIATYRGANPKKLAELIYAEGAGRARLVLFCILAAAMTGGYTASGEVKPTTGTKATPDVGKPE